MLNIVKNTTFPSLLDLLAPHSCRSCGALGTVLCDCCKKNIIHSHHNLCPLCKTKKSTPNCLNCHDTPDTFIVGSRQDLIGELINDLKFHSVRALAQPLAEILDAILTAELATPNQRLVIIPLPTIKKHVRARGLDHTLLIAKHLAKLHPNYSVEKLLLRQKNTVQVGQGAATRRKQASSAYALNPKIKIDRTATYLLLDDVWTTGASMLAAAELAQKSSIKPKNLKLAVLAVSSLS